MSQMPHDALFKTAFSEPETALGFLRHALPPLIAEKLNPTSLRQVSETFIDPELTQRQSDLLFEARLDGEPVLLYILFEHQSTIDPMMPFRLLRYMVRLWEHWLKTEQQSDQPAPRGLPPIVPLVLYHGQTPWNGPRTLAELLLMSEALRPAFAPLTPDFRFELKDLSSIPDGDLWGTPFGKLVLALLKHSRSAGLFAKLERLKDLFEQVAQARGLEMFETVFIYLMNTSEELEAEDIYRFVNETLNLDDAGRNIMTLAERLKEEGRRQGRQEGRQEGRLEGRQEGRLEGRLEGRQEGRLEVLRGVLLRLLQLKFTHVPETAAERINAAGPADLERWTERVISAVSIEDVFA